MLSALQKSSGRRVNETRGFARPAQKIESFFKKALAVPGVDP
jgi:hypothetical protein